MEHIYSIDSIINMKTLGKGMYNMESSMNMSSLQVT